jgi:TatD DNase family protein
MFIDTHAHLADARFNIDRDLVIKRAIDNKVQTIIEISCEPGMWNTSLDILRINPNIYGAFGVHPHDAKHADLQTLALLKKHLLNPKIIAIGETGFDFFYNHSAPEIQKLIFTAHINLSKELNKPLIIHCRDAYNELFEILRKETTVNKIPGVVHCFSGNLEQANELIKMGFYLGIDGPVTYKKSDVLKEVVKEVPLERMLLETDCPYLAPQKHRGGRNEPSYIPLIAEQVAAIKNIPIEQLAQTTTANAKQLFHI